MQDFSEFQKYYETGDPSHDWLHVKRVVSMCHKLADELGAEKRLLIPAAYLHDVVNVPKDSKHRAKASRLAADKARKLLDGCGYTDEEIAGIAQIILEHSFSANIPPSSIQSAILQDADKLDGIGAIGVMRWATCGARMGATYYHEDDIWADDRDLDDRTYSLDHFEAKLLKICDRINTEPAKAEAERRSDFMRHFLDQLNLEIP